MLNKLQSKKAFILISLFAISIAAGILLIKFINAEKIYEYTDVLTFGSIGENTHENLNDMVSDSSNNVYVVGSFFGTVDFDTNHNVANDTLTAVGRSMYVAKYNSTDTLLWVFPIYGVFGDEIDIDSSGNIYIVGQTNAGIVADVDPSGSVNNIQGSISRSFFAKYDNNGNFIWARQTDTTGAQDNRSDITNIDVTDSGVYLTGSFYGTLELGSDDFLGVGTTDTYVAKYTPDGDYVWGRTAGSPRPTLDVNSRFFVGFKNCSPGGSGQICTYHSYWNSTVYPESVQVNGDDVYITGYFDHISDFDLEENSEWAAGPMVDELIYPTDFDPYPRNVPRDKDAFLAKYDDNTGDFIWVKAFGRAQGKEIRFDSNGNLYLAGSYAGISTYPAVFAPGNSRLAAYTDLFLSKYASNGNFQWVRTWGGNQPDSAIPKDTVQDLFIDSSNNIHLAGGFYGTADFDPSDAGVFKKVTANSSLGGDGYYLNLDSNGQFLGALTVGTDGGDSINAVLVDNAGKLRLGGYYQRTADFDPSEVGTLNKVAPGVANRDMFLTIYEEDIPDTQPPSVILITGAGGAVDDPSTTCEWSASDTENPILAFELLINGVPTPVSLPEDGAFNELNETFVKEFFRFEFTDGVQNEVILTATDASGNKGESVACSFTFVDNMPVIDFIDTPPSEILKGQNQVNVVFEGIGSVINDIVESITVSVDGSEEKLVNQQNKAAVVGNYGIDNEVQFAIDLTDLEGLSIDVGDHVAVFKITDKDGDTNSYTANFKIIQPILPPEEEVEENLITPILIPSSSSYDVDPNEPFTLSWTTTSICSLEVAPSIGSNLTPQSSSQPNVTIQQTTTFTFTGTPCPGSTTNNPVIATLTVSVSETEEDEETELVDTDGDGEGDTEAPPGSTTVVTDDGTIIVIPPVIIPVIEADATCYDIGEESVLTWTTENAESLTIDYPNPKTQAAINGSLEILTVRDIVVTFLAVNGNQLSETKVEINRCATTINLNLPSLTQVSTSAPGAVLLLPVVSVVTSGISLASANPAFRMSLGFLIDLLRLLGLLPKKKRNGYVYNSETKEPVSFALIHVKSSLNGEIIESMVTDSDGTFFNPYLPIGSYSIDVTHDQFNFPTNQKRLPAVSVNDFYKGEVIEIGKDQEQLSLIIPIDPKVKGEKVKGNKGRQLSSIMRKLLDVVRLLFIPLFIYSIILFVQDPTVLNLIIVALYILMLLPYIIKYLRAPALSVTIKDKATNKPIKDVVIRLHLTSTNQLTAFGKTDSRGKANFFIPKDMYYYSAIKDGFVTSLDEGFGSVHTINLNKAGKLEIRMVRNGQ